MGTLGATAGTGIGMPEPPRAGAAGTHGGGSMIPTPSMDRGAVGITGIPTGTGTGIRIGIPASTSPSAWAGITGAVRSSSILGGATRAISPVGGRSGRIIPVGGTTTIRGMYTPATPVSPTWCRPKERCATLRPIEPTPRRHSRNRRDGSSMQVAPLSHGGLPRPGLAPERRRRGQGSPSRELAGYGAEPPAQPVRDRVLPEGLKVGVVSPNPEPPEGAPLDPVLLNPGMLVVPRCAPEPLREVWPNQTRLEGGPAPEVWPSPVGFAVRPMRSAPVGPGTAPRSLRPVAGPRCGEAAAPSGRRPAGPTPVGLERGLPARRGPRP
jgi:hypothetical protein